MCAQLKNLLALKQNVLLSSVFMWQIIVTLWEVHNLVTKALAHEIGGRVNGKEPRMGIFWEVVIV